MIYKQRKKIMTRHFLRHFSWHFFMSVLILLIHIHGYASEHNTEEQQKMANKMDSEMANKKDSEMADKMADKMDSEMDNAIANDKMDSTKKKKTENIRDTYADTLEYGIESSVIETIKTLQDLQIKGFEKQVLQRIQESNREALITEGIAYLRTLSYEDKEAIDFSLSIIEKYEEQSRKAVQFAIFYIGEHIDLLTENDIDFLKTITLDIIDTDIPSISLAMLELLPSIYSERDIAYVSSLSDDSQKKDQSKDNTSQTTEDMPKDMAEDMQKNTTEDMQKDMPKNMEAAMETTQKTPISQVALRDLYSTQLKAKYDEINTPIIQNQIVAVLGEIKAYNQIDFILEIAEDENASNSNKGGAIKALTYFDEVSSDIYEKIDALLEKERDNKTPEIRVSIMEALEIFAINTKQEKYVLWMKEGLRDQEQGVRKQSLEGLSNIYEQDVSIASEDIVFSAVKYMVKNDPEPSVKKTAMHTLSLLDGGSDYLITQINTIVYLSPDTKGLIDIGVGKIADKGGIAAIEALAKRSIEKKNDSLLEYIAGAMSKESNDGFGTLVGILLRYTNNSVLLASLSTIGRNNITTYNAQLAALSLDISQTSAIRNKAKEIVSLGK